MAGSRVLNLGARAANVSSYLHGFSLACVLSSLQRKLHPLHECAALCASRTHAPCSHTHIWRCSTPGALNRPRHPTNKCGRCWQGWPPQPVPSAALSLAASLLVPVG